MKIYSDAPDGNEVAINEPARYFNLALEQINKISTGLKTWEENAEPLLVHIDIFIYLGKKYPEMAKERLEDFNVNQARTAFFDWYERCKAKIPAKFRENTKTLGESLFSEMDKLKK
jgi:hypothetical protein